MSEKAWQQCLNTKCQACYSIDESHFACPKCGDLLDVRYDWAKLPVPKSLADFEKRWATRANPLDLSGVWRFRDLLPFCPTDYCATLGEGQTLLQSSDGIANYVGSKPGNVFLQYEGLNPSGSFKDNGMAAAFSHARLVAAKHVACASTGNTSASVALFAHYCNMACTVFIGSGRIAYGKLSQALDYGANTLQILGDFDDCMRQVKNVCKELKLYLVNSLNPFRLEGQKTIMYRVLEALRWKTPDWVIVPGGNLGNSSAFGKAFAELKELGLITRIPRLAVINAHGANTLFELHELHKMRFNNGNIDSPKIDAYYKKLDDAGYKPKTLATAIEISRPVNLSKCLRALDVCDGVVREVTDDDILDAKAAIAKFGLGCEPASAASVAGLKLLRQQGVIAPSDRVACVLTGHVLKDPTVTVKYHIEQNAQFSNKPIEIPNDLTAIIDQMRKAEKH